jgi:hypothetical protein
MSKPGYIALVLLVVTAIGVGIAAYRSPHEDAQDALVIPFVVFWTIVAALGIVIADRLVRGLWRRVVRRRSISPRPR